MALERHEARQPFRVAALRLLLLTGCRKSEIVTLEWRFYRDGRLYLGVIKTGPHTVWLCEAAREVLDGLPRSSRFVFPIGNRRAPWSWLDAFWIRRVFEIIPINDDGHRRKIFSGSYQY